MYPSAKLRLSKTHLKAFCRIDRIFKKILKNILVGLTLQGKEYLPSPRTLNTNIKTRRLGYVIGILQILENKFLDIDGLIEKLENWAESNSNGLSRYASNSGWIKKTPKHYPSLRYIRLAEELKLIKVTERECGVTKFGQPALYLTSTKSNPFDLTYEQICYFLKRILVNDYDIFLPLLNLLISPHRSSEIFDNLKKAILEHLKFREKSFGDIVRSSEFRNRIQSIERWSNEREYLEHIIYPRLDWLLDLKMVNLEKARKREYELIGGCSSFLNSLNSIYSEEKLEKWFDNEYYESFLDIFEESLFKGKKSRFIMLTEDQQFEKLRLLVEECFVKFSSAGLPFQHLSARTFLEYSCVKLVSKGIVATFELLTESLKKMTGYKFRWEPMLGDGYITRA